MATVAVRIRNIYDSEGAMECLLTEEIPNQDYRNEIVIAAALRKLADEMEKGAHFQGVPDA